MARIRKVRGENETWVSPARGETICLGLGLSEVRVLFPDNGDAPCVTFHPQRGSHAVVTQQSRNLGVVSVEFKDMEGN